MPPSFSPSDLQSPGLQVLPKAPAAPAPVASQQTPMGPAAPKPVAAAPSSGPSWIGKAEAADYPPAPTAPPPVATPKTSTGYKLTSSTINGWLSNGKTTLAEAHSAAMAVDPDYKLGVQRLNDYAKAHGQPYGNDPQFIQRAMSTYYKVGEAPKANDDTNALLQALHEQNKPIPPVTSQNLLPPPDPNGPMGQVPFQGVPILGPAMQDANQNVKNMGDAYNDFTSGKQRVQDAGKQILGNAVSGVLQPVTHLTAALMKPFELLPDAAGKLGEWLGNNTKTGQAINAKERGVEKSFGPQLTPVHNVLKGLIKTAQDHANDPGVKSAKALGQAALDTVNAITAAHMAGGAMDVANEGFNSARESVSEKASGVMNKIRGVDPEAEAAKADANKAFESETNRLKTHEDLSVPARSTSNDIEFSRKGQANVQDGKVIGYKADPEVTETLKKVVTDPNNIPQSLGEIETAKGTMSDQAREELRKQTAGQINEFKTERYQNAATKELRKVFSDTIQNEDNQLHLVGDGDTPQKVSTLLENKYAKLLEQSGEKEEAKLDLRQWLDTKIGNKAFEKDLAELTPNQRAMMLFRKSLNASIDENAAALGGKYGEHMKEISNLYKAEETASSHMPKPESLKERFTVDKQEKMPNEIAPTHKEFIKQTTKDLGKKILRGTIFGAGVDVAEHLRP